MEGSDWCLELLHKRVARQLPPDRLRRHQEHKYVYVALQDRWSERQAMGDKGA